MDYIDNIRRSIGRVNKMLNALKEIEDEIEERDDMARNKKEIKQIKELDEEIDSLINVVSLSAYKYERQYTGKPLPNIFDQLRIMTDNKVDNSKQEAKEERKKHNARVQREYKIDQ